MVTADFLLSIDKDKKAELDALKSRLHGLLGHELPIYTDHSLAHSKRVIENIDKILLGKRNNFKNLNDNEKICLAACCLLHDIGMSYHVSTSQAKMEETKNDLAMNPTKFRKKHAKISAYLIRVSGGLKKGDDVLRINLKDTLFSDMAEDIAWICEKHSGNVSREDLESSTSLGRKQLRRGLILCLLRLADELDRTYERIDMRVLRLMSIPPESMLHWYLHYYTKSLITDDGIIKLAIRFPDLPADAPSKLKAKIIMKITSEINLVKIPLMKWGIGIQFDDQDVEEHILNNLEVPDEEVLNLLIGVDDSKIKIEKSSSSGPLNWIQYWRFNGNPWFDKLLGTGSKLLIRTKSMNEIISETLSIAKGPAGGIRLIVAQRRAGKTTLYRVMDEILKREGCTSYYIDTLNPERAILSGRDLFYYVKRQATKIAQEISGESYSLESKEPKDFNVAFQKSENKNVVLFLDNLDRLVYDDESEREIINDFLTLLQTLTDQVQDRWYVLICVPTDWMNMLRDDSFLYLRPDSCRYLEGFNKSEAWELISKRIEWAGRKSEEIIDQKAAEKICEISGGLPGRIIQNAEQIFRSTANKENFIAGEHLEEYWSHKLKIARKQAAIEAVQISRDAEKGLMLLYKFQRTAERLQDDPVKLFRIVTNSLKRISMADGSRYRLEFLSVEIPHTLSHSPLSIILERKEEKMMMGFTEGYSHTITYYLKKEVTIFLEALENRGIDSRMFLMDFSENPIKSKTGHLVDIDDKDELPPQVSKDIDKIIKNLALAENDGLSEQKRIEHAWQAVLDCINIGSQELHIKTPNFKTMKKYKPILFRQLQQKAVNEWVSEIQSKKNIHLSSKRLIDYVSYQVISAAHMQERGHSRYNLDVKATHDSAKSIIREIISKIGYSISI